MTLMTDHISEFLQSVADEAPDAETARTEVEASARLVFGPPPTRTVPADELEPGMVIVGDGGGQSAVTGEVGWSSTIPGCVRVEVEHGALYLDGRGTVQIVAG